ncbi:MAG: hypothetical protein HXX11_05225 [Desulfuromonadales bacterium]|nr:hypothetical protein [Desulfuromonadales bacterium]
MDEIFILVCGEGEELFRVFGMSEVYAMRDPHLLSRQPGEEGQDQNGQHNHAEGCRN